MLILKSTLKYLLQSDFDDHYHHLLFPGEAGAAAVSPFIASNQEPQDASTSCHSTIASTSCYMSVHHALLTLVVKCQFTMHC